MSSPSNNSSGTTSSDNSAPSGPAPSIPYWKRGLAHLENMGNFSENIEIKSKQVESNKKYLQETITNIQKAIEDIQKGINTKEETCDKLQDTFDKAIEDAIGNQKKQLETMFNNIKEISDFNNLKEALDALKGNVTGLGANLNPQVAVNDNTTTTTFEDTNSSPFIYNDSNLNQNAGYTYGKLKKRSRRKRRGKKSPKRKGKKSKKRN